MPRPERNDEIVIVPVAIGGDTATDEVITGGWTATPHPVLRGVGAIGVLVAAVAVLVGRHDPAGRTAAPVPAPTPTPVASLRADGSYVYESSGHCPIGALCAYDDSLSAGQVQLAMRLFPGSRSLTTNAWFDGRTGNVFDQRIALVTGQNVAVALTVHRVSASDARSAGVEVRAEPDWPDSSGQYVTVVARRGGWLLTARLIGGRPSGELPIADATSWLLSVPTPRWTASG